MSKLVSINTFVKEIYAAYKRGDGYIMGSKGQNPRTGQMDLNNTTVKSSWKENGWFFTQYSGSQRTQALKWRKNCTRVWDCNGMAEGVYEIYTGINIDSKARYNYQQWCSPKNSGLIPIKYRVPGAAIFWGSSASSIHHVGYLYKPVNEGHPEGDWYIIEARGVAYGVVMTKLNSRKPNFWGWMTKYYDYENALQNDVPVYSEVPATTTKSVYKNGDEGAAVKAFQSQLIELGYDLGKWGADGDFGDCTEMAVKKFQEDAKINADGKVGPETLAALTKALSAAKEQQEEKNSQTVVIKNGNCYVRTLPNTTGEIIGVAYNGNELPYGGEINEETRWLKVIYKEKEGWVSYKYGSFK